MSCGFGSVDLDRSVQGSIISQTLDQLSKDMDGSAMAVVMAKRLGQFHAKSILSCI